MVGGGDGLELTGHHARGHADPGRQYRARGASTVIAVVGGDHGKRDLAIGEGVEGALGAGGDLDFVTDGATVAAAVEDQRVVWQHLWGRWLSSFFVIGRRVTSNQVTGNSRQQVPWRGCIHAWQFTLLRAGTALERYDPSGFNGARGAGP